MPDAAAPQPKVAALQAEAARLKAKLDRLTADKAPQDVIDRTKLHLSGVEAQLATLTK